MLTAPRWELQGFGIFKGCKSGQNLGDAINNGEKENLVGGGTKGVVGKVWLPTSKKKFLFFFFCFLFFVFCFFFCFSRAAPLAYGGSQARGPIGAVAAGLRHSYSNTGSEPNL